MAEDQPPRTHCAECGLPTSTVPCRGCGSSKLVHRGDAPEEREAERELAARQRAAGRAAFDILGPVQPGSFIVVPESAMVGLGDKDEQSQEWDRTTMSLFKRAIGHSDFVVVAYDDEAGGPVAVLGRDELKGIVREVVDEMRPPAEASDPSAEAAV